VKGGREVRESLQRTREIFISGVSDAVQNEKPDQEKQKFVFPVPMLQSSMMIF